jgi:hypothetical protein
MFGICNSIWSVVAQLSANLCSSKKFYIHKCHYWSNTITYTKHDSPQPISVLLRNSTYTSPTTVYNFYLFILFLFLFSWADMTFILRPIWLGADLTWGRFDWGRFDWSRFDWKSAMVPWYLFCLFLILL